MYILTKLKSTIFFLKFRHWQNLHYFRWWRPQATITVNDDTYKQHYYLRNFAKRNCPGLLSSYYSRTIRITLYLVLRTIGYFSENIRCCDKGFTNTIGINCVAWGYVGLSHWAIANQRSQWGIINSSVQCMIRRFLIVHCQQETKGATTETPNTAHWPALAGSPTGPKPLWAGDSCWPGTVMFLNHEEHIKT